MRDTFYPRNTASLTKEHFANCFQIVGFAITPDELNALWSDLGGEKNNLIELPLFFTKLSCWKDELAENKHTTDVISNLNMEIIEVFLKYLRKQNKIKRIWIKKRRN